MYGSPWMQVLRGKRISGSKTPCSDVGIRSVRLLVFVKTCHEGISEVSKYAGLSVI